MLTKYYFTGYMGGRQRSSKSQEMVFQTQVAGNRSCLPCNIHDSHRLLHDSASGTVHRSRSRRLYDHRIGVDLFDLPPSICDRPSIPRSVE